MAKSFRAVAIVAIEMLRNSRTAAMAVERTVAGKGRLRLTQVPSRYFARQWQTNNINWCCRTGQSLPAYF